MIYFFRDDGVVEYLKSLHFTVVISSDHSTLLIPQNKNGIKGKLQDHKHIIEKLYVMMNTVRNIIYITFSDFFSLQCLHF